MQGLDRMMMRYLEIGRTFMNFEGFVSAIAGYCQLRSDAACGIT
jgi:hypothetical protein